MWTATISPRNPQYRLFYIKCLLAALQQVLAPQTIDLRIMRMVRTSSSPSYNCRIARAHDHSRSREMKNKRSISAKEQKNGLSHLFLFLVTIRYYYKDDFKPTLNSVSSCI
ncbi:hypothetical protein H2248_003506 [Termitomyces sp. 'cryptogamus']|nr:hypothetical protein H2248_003506 [Termitomyces sp. 'cryptogamus']